MLGVVELYVRCRSAKRSRSMSRSSLTCSARVSVEVRVQAEEGVSKTMSSGQ